MRRQFSLRHEDTAIGFEQGTEAARGNVPVVHRPVRILSVPGTTLGGEVAGGKYQGKWSWAHNEAGKRVMVW